MEIEKSINNILAQKANKKKSKKQGISKGKENEKEKEEKEQEVKEAVKRAKYGYETGAPPIVVVVQGGKGVSFIFFKI